MGELPVGSLLSEGVGGRFKAEEIKDLTPQAMESGKASSKMSIGTSFR
jgi:hypothetical protein